MTPMKMFDLAGRVALVTGAGSGIGRSAASLFAEHGAAVVLCGRRRAKLEEVQATLTGAGHRAAVVTMDVADESDVRRAVASASEAFGPIDILLNNAGVASHTSVIDTTGDGWDAIVDTNLKGSWACAREVAARLIAARRPGSIVNVASILGMMTQKGTGPYAASKAGLLHLTKVMAAEWARYGIRVNGIAPGYFATDMADDFLVSERGKKLIASVPQRRAGKVEELSGVLLLLASEASSYITGTTIVVDGGLMLGQL